VKDGFSNFLHLTPSPFPQGRGESANEMYKNIGILHTPSPCGEGRGGVTKVKGEQFPSKLEGAGGG